MNWGMSCHRSLPHVLPTLRVHCTRWWSVAQYSRQLLAYSHCAVFTTAWALCIACSARGWQQPCMRRPAAAADRGRRLRCLHNHAISCIFASSTSHTDPAVRCRQQVAGAPAAVGAVGKSNASCSLPNAVFCHCSVPAPSHPYFLFLFLKVCSTYVFRTQLLFNE